MFNSSGFFFFFFFLSLFFFSFSCLSVVNQQVVRFWYGHEYYFRVKAKSSHMKMPFIIFFFFFFEGGRFIYPNAPCPHQAHDESITTLLQCARFNSWFSMQRASPGNTEAYR